MTNRYVISDASKMLNVEPHVLRNWEYELKLIIPRNELGHRYYTDDTVEELLMVKKLKEHGFALKYIKLLLPMLPKLEELTPQELDRLRLKLCSDMALTDSDTDKESKPETQNQVFYTTDNFTNYHDISGKVAVKQTETSSSLAIQEGLINALLPRFEDMLNNILKDSVENVCTNMLNDMTQSLTTSLVKELNYHLIARENQEAEHYARIENIIFTLGQKKKKRLLARHK